MSAPSPNTFKVAQLNAENLFLFLDDRTPRNWSKMTEKEWQKLSNASIPNKSLSKTLRLAEALLHIDADLVCINEVGGLESLENFSKLFLSDRYAPHLIEGNSDRGIDVGFLLKRGFRLEAELRTHKDRPLDFLYPHERQSNLFYQDSPEKQVKTHYFSRDCAELRLLRPGSERPVLVVLLVHLKSKLDPDGIDPQGFERRQAEFKTLMEIYKEIRGIDERRVGTDGALQPPPPVLVVGDFNGCARRDNLSREFSELTATDLHCAIESCGISGSEAATQMQFQRGGTIYFLQIDFILVSEELRSRLVKPGTHVHRYHSDLKIPLPLPTTLDQRLHLPSDHYPVVAVFEGLF